MKINSTPIEDPKLINALNQDDIFAFNELFHKYSQKIYNFTIKHVHHEEDVKDIVQEVFITIWNKRKDIDAKQSFNGYLFAITLNAIRKHFRNIATNKKVLDGWLKNRELFSSSFFMMLMKINLFETEVYFRNKFRNGGLFSK